MAKSKHEKQKAFLEWQRQDRLEHNALRRKMNTHFLFWTVCQDKACERARGCAGKVPDDCFDRWWPVVPEEVKIEFRAAIVGVGQKGMSLDEAMTYARGEVARWKADEALCAQMMEEQSAPAIAPESINAPANAPSNAQENPSVSGPRIRSL